MTAAQLVSLGLCITAAAMLADRQVNHRRRRVLRRLAASWRLNYSPFDPLRLTAHVAQNFPLIGAANVQVSDIIYGIEGDHYRYIFTAEFTTGVVRTKRRRLRAATFLEPRDHRGGQTQVPLELAPAHLRLIEQYKHLRAAAMLPSKTASSGQDIGSNCPEKSSLGSHETA